MFLLEIQCLYCKHFKMSEKEDENLTCNAFPEGIPDDILGSDHDHRKSFKGDNGILFEPDNPDDPYIKERLKILFGK